MPSCSFSIGENGKLKGKLKKESGNGWLAGINGSPEVSGHQDGPQPATYLKCSWLLSFHVTFKILYISMYVITYMNSRTCSLTCVSCACVYCVQLLPCDVKYGSLRITDYKLLKRAVRDMGYPPVISCAVTYREELRQRGRPVWVCLDLLGADTETELTFMCKAYEEVGCQQLDGNKNGEFEGQGHSQTALAAPSVWNCSLLLSCFASSAQTACSAHAPYPLPLAASAAAQSPLTPPPIMAATTPPQADTGECTL